MALSEEQKNAVAKWFAAGEGVAEIQKHISSEFGIDLTYLDVRLLVADLPQPVEPEPVKDERPGVGDLPPVDGAEADAPDGYGVPAGETEAEGTAPGFDDAATDSPGQDGQVPPQADDQAAQEQGAGELSVAVDPLAPPGVIACGSVTFSDGTTGKWMLDQMGRLGLSGLPEGYRPSPEDGAQFQPKLLAALRAKGLV